MVVEGGGEGGDGREREGLAARFLDEIAPDGVATPSSADSCRMKDTLHVHSQHLCMNQGMCITIPTRTTPFQRKKELPWVGL